MAGHLNCVELIGNLGADPEVKALASGAKVANLRLATSESWRDKESGERKEKTEWHRIVIWNEGLVKIAEQYLAKGDKIYVRGKVETRKWEKDGQDHYSTEVVLTGFDAKLLMLSTKGGGEGGGARDQGRGENEYAKATGKAPRNNQHGGVEDMNDDIPF